jgi:electron transport complex protein RnfB
LCIKACPVDAIVGAAKRMHTVLTASCTGCDLCLLPCPVDCIDMVELETLARRGNRHAAALAAQSIDEMAAIARERFGFHEFRVAREQEERSDRLAKKARDKLADLGQLPGSHDLERKKAAVQAAIARARARRTGPV